MSPNPTLPYLYLFSKQKFFSKSVLLKILNNCLFSASELTSLCQMLVPKKYQAFVSCSVSVMATESFLPLSLSIVGECIQKSFSFQIREVFFKSLGLSRKSIIFIVVIINYVCDMIGGPFILKVLDALLSHILKNFLLAGHHQSLEFMRV